MSTTAPGTRLAVEVAGFAASLLGGDLPPAAERHLRQASAAYTHPDLAETHLREAQAIAPDHAAVLIALYRFHFYRADLEAARRVALLCIAKAARELGLPADWHIVTASLAPFGDFGAISARFFLFSLKGYAYLQMRLGHLDEGSAAIAKLLELDPTDKIGAGVLRDVLLRREVSEDD